MSGSDRRQLMMLWGGYLAALALWYGLRAGWFPPVLALTVAHFGAQGLEHHSLWYRYASFAAIFGILILILSGAIDGRAIMAARLWLMIAFAVFSLLGLRESRGDK